MTDGARRVLYPHKDPWNCNIHNCNSNIHTRSAVENLSLWPFASECQVYRAHVESLHNVFSCVESIAECQFGSNFETAIIVAFENTILSEGDKETIEEAF